MLANRTLPAGSEVANRYRIVAPLARGGFGAVYKAEQLATERMVAMKLLCSIADDDPCEAQLREARVTSRIVSDHIVQVIDAGIDSELDAVFVVMELLQGMTLGQLVREQGAQPKHEAAEIVRQIAVGLDRAHGNVDVHGQLAPIVHRDLKPANVFRTTRDDGSMLIKILDFGMAKLLSHSAEASGVVRGTPRYMAPEQAAGGEVTIQTDIWALGLVAFYLLTGHQYWLSCTKGSSTTPELFSEVLALPLEPATQRARRLGIATDLGGGFDRWFARCVNRDPSQRFASAGAAASSFLSALELAPPESDSLGEDSTMDASTLRPLALGLEQTETFERTSVVATQDLVSEELEPSRLPTQPQASETPKARRKAVWLAAPLSGVALVAFLWLPSPQSSPSSQDAPNGAASIGVVPLLPDTRGQLPPTAVSAQPSASAPVEAEQAGVDSGTERHASVSTNMPLTAEPTRNATAQAANQKRTAEAGGSTGAQTRPATKGTSERSGAERETPSNTVVTPAERSASEGATPLAPPKSQRNVYNER